MKFLFCDINEVAWASEIDDNFWKKIVLGTKLYDNSQVCPSYVLKCLFFDKALKENILVFFSFRVIILI